MKKIKLAFTELEIYDDYVIGRTREGVDLSLSMHQEALQAIGREIDGPWGLILDMVNSYSTQLSVIHAVRDNLDIHSVAVVCYREASDVSMRQAAEMIQKPTIITRDLDQARAWLRKNQPDPVSA